jgi:hypothetical protein
LVEVVAEIGAAAVVVVGTRSTSLLLMDSTILLSAIHMDMEVMRVQTPLVAAVEDKMTEPASTAASKGTYSKISPLVQHSANFLQVTQRQIAPILPNPVLASTAAKKGTNPCLTLLTFITFEFGSLADWD